MGNLSALFTAVFPVNSAWPGTGLRTHLQEEAVWEDRVGVGQGEEKQGETLIVPLSSRAGTHKWSFAHPHPSPGSFPSLRTLGATLGQCPGTEVDRLAFFAWAQRQTSPGLSDLSAEQLINPESEIRQRDNVCSPVTTHPFSKEGLQLCLYLGSFHSRKHQSRTKQVKRDLTYFLLRGRNIKCSPPFFKLRTKNKIPFSK